MSVENLLIIAVWLPFVGFFLNGLMAFLGKNNRKIISILGVGSVLLSFFIFAYLTLTFDAEVTSVNGIQSLFFKWIHVGDLQVNFAYRLDGLSVFMSWIVTGIGSLIHIYSTGYMKEEKEHFARFFTYLNLFIFFMLHLVLADNLVLMFMGWEGVGLCSYLLIGFDYHKDSAASAGKKAFITNRVGDAGFLLGMFLLFKEVGSLNYNEIFSHFSGFFDSGLAGTVTGSLATPLQAAYSAETMNLIAILLFIGAIGKSAQIPLYVWLPDAMAGPTPVSALIHAATMVTAGLFMIVRLAPVFLLAPEASTIIAYTGGLTAFFAALIALTQTDIKKVLAYSTVSQLGYMFLAMGVGAYGAGMFHLMTHAFFKALLFLGSGAVILALHHQQDMRKMGGLLKPLKFIAIIFWVGAIAISGIPGFAGFFSKDMILEQAFTFRNGGTFLFSVGLLTALLTSFYMYRLIFLTFHGEKYRSSHKPHDVDWSMKFPLLVLAILSVLGGYVGLPHLFTHKPAVIVTYFDSILPVRPTEMSSAWHIHISSQTEVYLMILSIGAALLGLLIAWWKYQRTRDVPVADGAYRSPLVRQSFHKFYVDELYESLLLKPMKKIADISSRALDNQFIDGIVDGLAQVALTFSQIFRQMQTGKVGHYALYIVIFLLFMTLIIEGGFF